MSFPNNSQPATNPAANVQRNCKPPISGKNEDRASSLPVQPAEGDFIDELEVIREHEEIQQARRFRRRS